MKRRSKTSGKLPKPRRRKPAAQRVRRRLSAASHKSDNATLQGGAPCRGAAILTDWVSIYNFLDEFSRVAVVGRGTINISILSVDQSPIGVA